MEELNNNMVKKRGGGMGGGDTVRWKKEILS